HRRLVDGRVVGQHPLHLCRVDVEPADDHNVLQPVKDAQVAVGPDGADVAGVQPAVSVDHLGGGRRVVEVAGHHVGPPDEDLAGLAGRLVPAVGTADPEVDAVDRTAAGAGDHRHRVVGSG